MYNRESLERSSELTKIALINKKQLDRVSSGLDNKQITIYQKNKEMILNKLNASESEWNDYKWQLVNKIDNVEGLLDYVAISENEVRNLREISKKYRWSISPYYFALVDWNDDGDPIRKIGIPSIDELIMGGDTDPMCEMLTNPAGSITRRYPDRLIINVTNVCATYCRHCQRKRNIGETDTISSKKLIDESIEYINDHEEIRDVIITGGDPLTLSNPVLEDIIKRVRKIKHVEIIRIGSRIPVTLPQRIDSELVDMLKKYHPLYVNVQFNHPKEITDASLRACELLSNAGIPLGNQAVLLKNVNDDKFIQMKLNQLLLTCRVKPYYLFHAKQVTGTMHFNTSILKGLEIMKFLRGNTSGLAIPTYIINAPGGLGKIPIADNNVEFRDNGEVILTTWEGKKVKYRELE
jgi:lysine 2,3-aminomutase